jgi:hypothetical protein
VILKPSRAVLLMERMLRDGVVTEEDLAREIVVRPKTLDAYREGRLPMPLDRQLCLALVMMRMSPRHARLGAQLRAQVMAAIQYQQRLQAASLEGPQPAA